MNDGRIVVDASAILALLKREPFRGFEPRRLVRAHISAVNLSEVFERLYAGGLSEPEADKAVAALDLRVIVFDSAQAQITAKLRAPTRHAGLSLADRACLALGIKLGCPVVTADRVWAGLNVGVEVLLIR